MLSNILFAENGALFDPQVAGSTTKQFAADTTANKLSIVAGTASALFTSVPAAQPTGGATFDWAPPTAGAAATGGLATFTGALLTKAGTFIAGTAYRGAADPAGTKWWNGWTTYAIN